MARREVHFVGDTITVTFEENERRPGTVIAWCYRAVFPSRGSQPPKPSERWECEIVGENSRRTVWYVKLDRLISTSESRERERQELEERRGRERQARHDKLLVELIIPRAQKALCEAIERIADLGLDVTVKNEVRQGANWICLGVPGWPWPLWEDHVPLVPFASDMRWNHIRDFEDTIFGWGRVRPGRDEEIVTRLLEELRQHIAEDLEGSELADLVISAASYLNRCCEECGQDLVSVRCHSEALDAHDNADGGFFERRVVCPGCGEVFLR